MPQSEKMANSKGLLRSISVEEFSSTEPLPKVTSMMSLLVLDDDRDIEDIGSPNAETEQDQINKQVQQAKLLENICAASPKVSLEFAQTARPQLCPTCRRETCQVSRPPSGYFSAHQVSQHNKLGDCWLVANNIVYDVSRYLVKHPGGVETILSRAGKDASRDFDFHTEQGKRVWKRLAVGRLAECSSNGQATAEPCAIM